MQEPLPMTIEHRVPKPSAVPPNPRRAADWRIDAQTRRLGLNGVARARAALEASRCGHGHPTAA